VLPLIHFLVQPTATSGSQARQKQWAGNELLSCQSRDLDPSLWEEHVYGRSRLWSLLLLPIPGVQKPIFDLRRHTMLIDSLLQFLQVKAARVPSNRPHLNTYDPPTIWRHTTWVLVTLYRKLLQAMKSGQPCDANPVFFFAQESLKIRSPNVRLGTPWLFTTGLFCCHVETKRHYKKLDVDVMDNDVCPLRKAARECNSVVRVF